MCIRDRAEGDRRRIDAPGWAWTEARRRGDEAAEVLLALGAGLGDRGAEAGERAVAGAGLPLGVEHGGVAELDDLGVVVLLAVPGGRGAGRVLVDAELGDVALTALVTVGVGDDAAPFTGVGVLAEDLVGDRGAEGGGGPPVVVSSAVVASAVVAAVVGSPVVVGFGLVVSTVVVGTVMVPVVVVAALVVASPSVVVSEELDLQASGASRVAPIRSGRQYGRSIAG